MHCILIDEVIGWEEDPIKRENMQIPNLLQPPPPFKILQIEIVRYFKKVLSHIYIYIFFKAIRAKTQGRGRGGFWQNKS